MKTIDGGVCAPQGFRAGAAHAAIKLSRTTNDCALIVSDAPAAVAGVFTTNMVKAAPVHWCKKRCATGRAQAVFINSGNANACTGAQGAADCEATAELTGQALGLAADHILVCSTGVIGVPLPMDRIAAGIQGAAAALAPEGSRAAAEAIMTTDTKPKERAVEIELSGGKVRIGGIAKGAGMIAPNMATMLAFLTTDVAIGHELLHEALLAAAERSFNRICIDNDMSTNDTVLLLANGQAGLSEVQRGSDDARRFAEGLRQLSIQLAKDLVRDGEGVTKLVAITAEGAADDRAARRIAHAIATSQLCKTAFHGEDPNWGRIACAAGWSGANFDPKAMDIWIGEVQVMAAGGAADFEEADAAAVMKAPEFGIRVRVGDGPGRCIYWTSDLSHDYIRINADYRT